MGETTTPQHRILIIEDNPDTRQIYKDVFEREGFTVLVAEDGEKGLKFALATVPDIILLDLMLPKIEGFEILRQLRTNDETKNIPVLIFSALSDAADRKKATALGVTEYSVKGFTSPKQIVSRVRTAIEAAKGHVCPTCHRPL
jgi:DNA-binding response OmpR family regulator